MAYQQFKQYLVKCSACGGNTSKKYAREHDGKCKTCSEPNAVPATCYGRNNESILDVGYQAYAREEGHYE